MYPHLSLSHVQSCHISKTKTRRPSPFCRFVLTLCHLSNVFVIIMQVSSSLLVTRRFRISQRRRRRCWRCLRTLYFTIYTVLFLKRNHCRYYQGDVGKSKQDQGTVIRFLCGNSGLPGIVDVKAKFDDTKDALPIYSDHWVNSVVSD